MWPNVKSGPCGHGLHGLTHVSFGTMSRAGVSVTGLRRAGMNKAGVTRCISSALGVTFASTSVAGMKPARCEWERRDQA